MAKEGHYGKAIRALDSKAPGDPTALRDLLIKHPPSNVSVDKRDHLLWTQVMSCCPFRPFLRVVAHVICDCGDSEDKIVEILAWRAKIHYRSKFTTFTTL